MSKLIVTCVLIAFVGVTLADPHRPGKFIEHDRTVISCAKYKREANQHQCVLSPFNTEGPFYLPDDHERSDLTDGQVGVALDLTFNVVNSNDCSPMENMYVHLWHTNALGKYSGVNNGGGGGGGGGPPGSGQGGFGGAPSNGQGGFGGPPGSGQGGFGGPPGNGTDARRPPGGQGGPGGERGPAPGNGQRQPGGQGGPGGNRPGSGGIGGSGGGGGGGGGGRPTPVSDERWLRGYQVTDSNGQVNFKTIIPGWYTSRCLHMHIEVYPKNSTERADISYVGQIFFKTEMPNELKLIDPYSNNNQRITLNENDGIFKHHGNETTLNLIAQGNSFSASFTLGIDPTAKVTPH